MRKLSHCGAPGSQPLRIKLKSCLTFSASCLSNFTTQESWRASLLLKVIPLWSKCERKM